jgi:hypothetical protein
VVQEILSLIIRYDLSYTVLVSDDYASIDIEHRSVKHGLERPKKGEDETGADHDSEDPVVPARLR